MNNEKNNEEIEQQAITINLGFDDTDVTPEPVEINVAAPEVIPEPVEPEIQVSEPIPEPVEVEQTAFDAISEAVEPIPEVVPEPIEMNPSVPDGVPEPVEPEIQVSEPIPEPVEVEQTAFDAIPEAVEPMPELVEMEMPTSDVGPQKDKKNNKLLIVIIGIILLIGIGVGVYFLFIKDKPKEEVKKPDKNEVVTPQEDTPVEEEPIPAADMIDFWGFSFPKVGDYDYRIDNDTLYVSNGTLLSQIIVIDINYDDAKSEYQELIPEIQNNTGVSITNTLIGEYDAQEFILYEGSIDSKNMLVYITRAVDSPYSFFGIIANPEYTINHNIMYDFANIIANATYIGKSPITSMPRSLI